MPQYRRRVDGKIRLYSFRIGEIYVGLYEYLTEYFDKKGYEYSVLDSKHYGLPFETEDYVTPEGIAFFITPLLTPIQDSGLSTQASLRSD